MTQHIIFSRALVIRAMASIWASALVSGCGGSSGNQGPDPDGGIGQDGDGGIGQDGDSGIAPPAISELSLSDSPVRPGAELEVQASVNEAAGSSLSYDWTIPEGWAGDDTGKERITLTAPEEQATQGEVSVEVENEAGRDDASATVATAGPAIDAFSLDASEDPPWDPGVEITFTVDAQHYGDGELQYDYDLDGIWKRARGSEWTWTAAPRAMTGVYALRAVVEDDAGLSADASEEVAFTGNSSWPTFGGDYRRSGRARGADAAIDSESVSAGTPDELWGAEVGFRLESSPVLGPDGTVYVALSQEAEDGQIFDETQHLYAIVPNEGAPEVAWTYKIGNDLDPYMPPSLTVGPQGRVYMTATLNLTGTSQIHALDPAQDADLSDNERELWSHSTQDHSVFGPRGPSAVSGDGVVYIGGTGGGVYALATDPELHNDDDEENEVVWYFNTPSEKAIWGLALADGRLYVAGDDGYVGALDPDPTVEASERELWGEVREDVDGVFGSDVTVAPDGSVYVSAFVWYTDDEGDYTEYDELRALDPDPGADSRELWRYKVAEESPNGGVSPTVAADGTIYVASNDGAIRALNPDPEASTRELWAYALPTELREATAVLGPDGALYVGGADGVYALATDPSLNEEERQLWRYDTGSAVKFSPVLGGDGRVFAGQSGGRVSALR